MGLRARRLLALAPAGLALLLALGPQLTASGAAPAARPAAGTTTTTLVDDSGTIASSATSTTSTTLPASTSTSTTVPGPIKLVKGGTVTVAVPALPTQFNPNAPGGVSSVTAMVTAQLWPSPFVVGPSGSVQPSTEFDASELVNTSPETIVYTINPKARWSDGTPITAADFVEEWKQQLAHGSEMPAGDPLAGYQDIGSVRGSQGGKVVTVVFAKPYSDWEDLFASLVPAKLVRRYGWVSAFAGRDPKHLVSGGPFEVAKVVPGKELVLGRNPDWWGTPPLLDRIVFRVVRGQAAVLAGLEAGSIDLAQLPPSRSLNEAVWASADLGESVSVSPELWQLDFNLNDPVVSSLSVREALVKAIDRVELAADSVDLQQANDPLSGNHLFQVGAPGSQGNDGAYSGVDDTEAAELFAEAGYHQNARGVLRGPGGGHLVLQLLGPSGSPLVTEMEAELQAQLLDVGVTLQVHNVPQAELLNELLPQGGYQLALAPYLLSTYPSENDAYYEDPVSPLAATPIEAASPSTTLPPAPTTPGGSSSTSITITTSSTTTTTLPASAGSVAPLSGNGTEPDASAAGSVTRDVLAYEDPAVTRLLQQASAELNPVSMSGLYNEADTKIWADLPSLPLFQTPVELVYANDLVNLHQTGSLAGPVWNAEDWAIQILPPTPTATTVPTATPTSSATSSSSSSSSSSSPSPSTTSSTASGSTGTSDSTSRRSSSSSRRSSPPSSS